MGVLWPKAYVAEQLEGDRVVAEVNGDYEYGAMDAADPAGHVRAGDDAAALPCAADRYRLRMLRDLVPRVVSADSTVPASGELNWAPACTRFYFEVGSGIDSTSGSLYPLMRRQSSMRHEWSYLRTISWHAR